MLLAAGCRHAPQPPHIRIGIGAQQSVSQVPVYLAERLGYFHESGIDAELVEFPGASKGMEALLGGSIDVLSAYYSQVLQLREQGRDLKAFLSIHDSLLVALAVAPGSASKIRSVKDLKGAKVGVTTFGSATHQFLDFLLRTNGLDPKDVTPIAIGTAARASAAMERNQVDAAVVTDFTIRYLEKRFGKVSLLADTRTRDGVRSVHSVEAFPGTALMATGPWLDAHGDGAARVSAAVQRAMQWMRSHDAEAVVAQMPSTHYGEERLAYTAAVGLTIPLLTTNGAIDAAGARATYLFLGLTPQSTWANSFRSYSLPVVR